MNRFIVSLITLVFISACGGGGGGGGGDTTPTTPAPVVSLSASPMSVLLTETSTLTWSSSNATSCSASAFGIYVDDDVMGSITNAGTIIATATTKIIGEAEDFINDAQAHGIYVDLIESGGSITNKGTITTDATATSNRSADASASAFGILVDDGMSGSITNAGQNFLNAHAAVSNHFNLGRHLVSANHYRDLREDAFKNWNRAVA